MYAIHSIQFRRYYTDTLLLVNIDSAVGFGSSRRRADPIAETVFCWLILLMRIELTEAMPADAGGLPPQLPFRSAGRRPQSSHLPPHLHFRSADGRPRSTTRARLD